MVSFFRKFDPDIDLIGDSVGNVSQNFRDEFVLVGENVQVLSRHEFWPRNQQEFVEVREVAFSLKFYVIDSGFEQNYAFGKPFLVARIEAAGDLGRRI